MVLKRVMLALAMTAAIGGCSAFKGSKPKSNVVGERIPVLAAETGAVVEPSLADVPVALPAPAANDSWAQSGGNAPKSMGHLALAAAPQRLWEARIPAANLRARYAAAPVAAAGKLFVIDTEARVHAFDAGTGAVLWTTAVGSPADVRTGRDWWTGEPKGNSSALFGGGVSADGGRVYATSGLGDVAAFDAATGRQLWLKRPGGPLRGAPTLAADSVYVMSQDNQLFALDPDNGNTQWNVSGTLELSGVFGVGAPAFAQGTLIAGFSSGELNAYRYENGRVVWQDALSRTSISTSVSTLSDIDASPVVDEGRVYAVGQAGRMVALELTSGQRQWELNVAGIETPWLAGEWLFVETDDARLLCVARTTGKVRWIGELPRFVHPKSKKGATINYSGPVLAGGRLVLTSDRGDIVFVAPADGKVVNTLRGGKRFSLAPIVANSTLYTLSDEGRITAWR